MTPAEFRCAREFLGLSAQWLADKLGVNRRQVARWEQETGKPPPYAVLYLKSLLRAAERAVGVVTVTWREDHGDKPFPVGPAEDDDRPEGSLPPEWYRRIASRVHERTGIPLVYGITVEPATKEG